MIIWMSHKPHARWATLPMLATCACLSQVVRCTRCRIPGERRRAEPSARTARSSYEMLQLFTFLLQLHQNSGKLCNFGEIPWPRFGYFKNKGVTGDLGSHFPNKWRSRSLWESSCVVFRVLPSWDSLEIQSEVWRQARHSCHQLFWEAALGAPKRGNTDVCVS